MNDWGVWAIRAGISLVVTGGVAWVISFGVADYVAKANTANAIQTDQALLSSIDRLNETMLARIARQDEMFDLMTTLVSDGAARNRDIASVREDVDTDLRTGIADLTAELRETNLALARLETALSGLDRSVRDVSTRLDASVSRQVDFERWVVARLTAPIKGAFEDPPIDDVLLPADWKDAEKMVFRALTSEADPLTSWFGALGK